VGALTSHVEGNMKRITITLALAALLPLAAEDKKANVLLQAAQAKETVQGDLKGAIELYGQAVKEAGANRALAAKTLVQMAECYQRMGDAESGKIYERVVREYADQKEAVTVARARLGGTDSGVRVKGDRPVWTGPKVDGFGTISPDGRFLSYVDWAGAGNLVLRDLVAGTDRPLTNKGSWAESREQAEFSTISRDGKHLAYAWLNDKDRYELRIVGVQGTGIPQSRRLFGNEDIGNISPYDWSPDGKWIAVSVHRKDGTAQIGLVAAQDGALRVLKSVDWRGPTKIFFSPDSKYIAYDLSASDTSEERDVFVMRIDGSRETAAVIHPSQNVIMGWSPDGAHLLFASDRTRSIALWKLSFVEGKPQGAPEMVKPDIGSSYSLGLSASGALYVWKGVGAVEIQVAPLDLSAGKLMAAPVSAVQRFMDSPQHLDWSPDGKYLSYVSRGPLGGWPYSLPIRSMETGQVRELRPRLRNLGAPRWSPDGRSFLTSGTDLKGRSGIYQIDAQTGEASPILVGPTPAAIPQWSPDGKRIYYRATGRSAFLERDLASGNEREVIRLPSRLGEVNVSPDGRTIATISEEASSKSSTVLLIPVAGGAPRELLRLSLAEGFQMYRGMAWTPDSRAVIVTKSRGDRRELWLVPVTDGQPRKLDIDLTNWAGGFRLHPDGHQITFLAGKATSEIWALENFLPQPASKH